MTDQEYRVASDRVYRVKYLMDCLDRNLEHVKELESGLIAELRKRRTVMNNVSLSRLEGWIKSVIDEERVRLRAEYNESALEV